MMSDESFPKKERLVKTKDFRDVYKLGASFRRDPLVLYIKQNSSTENRIGFSVSSRVSKLAHERNRIKRMLRELYRRSKKDMKKGFDMVVVVKRNFLENRISADISNVFQSLLKKAGLGQ